LIDSRLFVLRLIEKLSLAFVLKAKLF